MCVKLIELTWIVGTLRPDYFRLRENLSTQPYLPAYRPHFYSDWRLDLRTVKGHPHTRGRIHTNLQPCLWIRHYLMTFIRGRGREVHPLVPGPELLDRYSWLESANNIVIRLSRHSFSRMNIGKFFSFGGIEPLQFSGLRSSLRRLGQLLEEPLLSAASPTMKGRLEGGLILVLSLSFAIVLIHDLRTKSSSLAIIHCT